MRRAFARLQACFAVDALTQLLAWLETWRRLWWNGNRRAGLGITACAAGADGYIERAETTNLHALTPHQRMANRLNDRFDRRIDVIRAKFRKARGERAY